MCIDVNFLEIKEKKKISGNFTRHNLQILVTSTLSRDTTYQMDYANRTFLSYVPNSSKAKRGASVFGQKQHHFSFKPRTRPSCTRSRFISQHRNAFNHFTTFIHDASFRLTRTETRADYLFTEFIFIFIYFSRVLTDRRFCATI